LLAGHIAQFITCTYKNITQPFYIKSFVIKYVVNKRDKHTFYYTHKIITRFNTVQDVLR